MKPYLIAEGLHFSDPRLINRRPESSCPPSFDKNITKAQAYDVLLEAVEAGDIDTVKAATDFIVGEGVCSHGNAVKITSKIAEVRNTPDHVLDMLDERGAIDRRTLVEDMRIHRNWAPVPWLLGNREKILLTEGVLGDPRDCRKTSTGETRASCLDLLIGFINVGGAEKAAGLDLAFILRDLDLEPGDFAKGVFAFPPNRMGVDVEHAAKLAEVVWSVDTYRLMRPDMEGGRIRESLAKGASVLVRHVLGDSSTTLEKSKCIERMVELSPNLAQAMSQYWKLPVEFLLGEHPGKWSYEDQKRLDEALPGLGKPKHRDLLDCAIRLGSDWVLDAFISQGPLHDQIVDRLRNDDGPLVASFILSLSPTDVHKYVSKIIELVGPEWKDSQGRGLGHHIIRACNAPTEHLLRTLLRTKDGVKLLAQKDGGKTALTFLEESDDWNMESKRKAELTQRARRKILQSISQAPEIERVKRIDVKM